MNSPADEKWRFKSPWPSHQICRKDLGRVQLLWRKIQTKLSRMSIEYCDRMPERGLLLLQPSEHVERDSIAYDTCHGKSDNEKQKNIWKIGSIFKMKTYSFWTHFCAVHFTNKNAWPGRGGGFINRFAHLKDNSRNWLEQRWFIEDMQGFPDLYFLRSQPSNSGSQLTNLRSQLGFYRLC